MFDVAVIGAGPGGYVAAIRAAQLGLKTVLIEKAEVGGICLNWGCIPTKALLRSAEIKTLIDRASDFGIEIEVESSRINFESIIQRSRRVSKQLTQGIRGLLKKNKIELVIGQACFKSDGSLEISGEASTSVISAKHTLIATGARARRLPDVPEHSRIWTSKEAILPPFQPKHLCIVGSGAIGIEFASFYHRLGTSVRVIEMLDRILPQEDLDISAEALNLFQKQGISFELSSQVLSIQPSDENVVVKTPNGEKIVDAVLMAIGVQGNIENLGLEEIGVQTEKGSITIDAWCQTSRTGVYAIGDVAGPPWLAHKASHEAILCVEHIAGMKDLRPLNRQHIPGCTYSSPQIASVGLTEMKAKEIGRQVRVGSFPYRANGKAIAMGETEGMIKTLFDAQTGELLGAHMIGAEVTEMIQGFVIALSHEATDESLSHTIFPHPTLSEMMHEAILDAQGRVIHR